VISKTSRYRRVTGFQDDPEGRPTFPGVRPREITSPPPVLEHVVKAWERPDQLALHYYNDPERWWLLGDANPGALMVSELVAPERAGETILIPRDEGK
jgi:hypothetical protein